jgi:hypothetical protein
VTFCGAVGRPKTAIRRQPVFNLRLRQTENTWNAVCSAPIRRMCVSPRRKFVKKTLIALSAVSLILFSACGKKKDEEAATGSPTPAPATASTPAAPAPAAAAAVTMFFEDASPGTPIKSDEQYDSAFNTLVKGFNGIGTANVTAEAEIEYTVTDAMTQNVKFVRGQVNNRQGAFPEPSYQMRADFNEAWQSFAIQFMPTRSDWTHVLVFRPEIEVMGLKLYSTDSVALFEEQGAMTRDFLKVTNYNGKTPTIQRFRVYDPIFTSRNQMRINVRSQTLTSNFPATQSR